MVKLRLLLLLRGQAELAEVVPDPEGGYFGCFERTISGSRDLQGLIVLLGERLQGAAERPEALLAIDSIELAVTPPGATKSPGTPT